MTPFQLEEGKQLTELIKSYKRTLEVFQKMKDEECKEQIPEFLKSMRMIGNKEQMAVVMRNAAIESCELCIKEAQEKFDSL